jgi:GT2 family glycosyltransferase
VILVESNQNNPPVYKNIALTIKYEGDFNYNKALNLAFDHVVSDYICSLNNDILAQNKWYSNIRYYMDVFDLDCASPWCPYPQHGPNEIAQKMLLSYPSHSVIIGYEAMIHIAGWCWVIKKNVLNAIRPFPEQLQFWFSDNYMGQQLKQLKYKAGTVTSGHMIHFGQQSYKHINPSQLYGMTNGLHEEYLKLIRKEN